MKTEILSPAGNKEAFLSAVHNGANAVYLGGLQFGARSQAQNFTTEEIIDLIKYAHLYNVKVYVTVNTLIKDNEFEEAVSFVEKLYLNNVDAIIVQDIGLASYLLNVYPDIVLHASTQMNVHSLTQAMFLKQLGFKRIVLARECSIETIKLIKQNVDIELEVFVHGALCMSYSGNCLMSSFIGKRSGNRGKCAQPCRLLYSLDDNDKPSYLLSPKDLMTLDYLNQLLDLKIDSLKIEGRMKRSEYVGLVTKIYSNAINNYNENNNYEIEKKQLKELFNREFTKGYLFNESNKAFTNTLFSNHIGVKVGKVHKTLNNYIFLKLEEPLVNGDSIRIVGKNTDAVTISEMYINNCLVKKANINDVVKIRCHKELDNDAIVLKTTNINLINEINNYQEKKILIDGNVFVENNKLVVELKYNDFIVRETSEQDVIESDNENFKNRIYDQINKINNTIYKFNKLNVNVNNIFLPISVINDLRRKAIEKLNEKRLYFKEKTINKNSLSLNNNIKNNEFGIIVKVLNEQQYLTVRKIFSGTVITENLKLYNDYKTENLLYLNPRIEEKQLLDGGIQNYSFGSNKVSFLGNYGNVFNSNSVLFYHNLGVENIGLSVELSINEINEIINEFYNKHNVFPNTSVMVYGRYELMLMKHCLINKKFGLNNKGCNKCLEKQYYLKDRMGFKFPLIKSGNCNIKLLNSKIVNLINNIDEIKQAHVSNIVIDFTIENEKEVMLVLSSFINKLNNNNVTLNINDVTYGHFNEGVL